MEHSRWAVTAAALTVFGLSFGAAVESRSAEPIRSILTPSARPSTGPRAPEQTVRERFVRIDRAPRGERLKLDLFPDVSVEAERLRTERTGPTGQVWIGRIVGGEGRVILSTVGNVTVGEVRTGGRLYVIRHVADGVHAVAEIDATDFPDEACGPPPPATGEGPRGEGRTGSSRPAEEKAPTSDPCNVIDMMVLYTPAAKDSAGGAEAMEAEIHLAISVSNITFEDSAVTVRISPVHIDEIDYVEAATASADGNAFDDRDALRDTADGEMDEVHALRDRYCADVVHLITDIGGNGNQNWCGAAYTMDPAPDSAHEVNGFAVTRRSCAAGNFTFAHETGHLLGARHDWYVDDATTPYAYAHGYVNRSELWRTVMAYNTECDDAFTNCERKGVWSSPNEFIDGQPAGIAENTSTSCTEDDLNNPDCDAENWRVLNATDCTVANFRDRSVCSASEARNVWMKDTWFDTGFEPDLWTAGQDMWKSPYIWVRNSPDPTGGQQHVHQNPEQGQTNYVYVKLHNDFDVPATGQLELYYAQASTGLTWPDDWTLFADDTVAIAAHATLLTPSTWNPPETGHFCLLARWTTPNSPADPMTHAEGDSVSDNTRMNNNIVWRNVNVANLVPNLTVPMPPLNVKTTVPGTEALDLAVELPDDDHNFLRAGGAILLDLAGLYDAWVGGGALGDGVRPTTHPTYGNVVEILETSSGVATLENIRIAAGAVEPIRFVLTAPFVPPPPPFPPQDDEPSVRRAAAGADHGPYGTLPANHFPLDIVQLENRVRVGGVGYRIEVEAQGGSGAVPDGGDVPGTPLTLSLDGRGNVELDWTDSCSATDVDYAVYAGTLGDFASHVPERCSTGGATNAVVPLLPTASRYFLVVPTDALTEGSFGRNGKAVERPAGAAPCRPHAVVDCN